MEQTKIIMPDESAALAEDGSRFEERCCENYALAK